MATPSNFSSADELDFRRDVDPNSIYELVSLLGEGSYGAVYSGKSREASKPQDVAIKIIPDADDDLTSLWREIRFLQVLRSPFVVSFIESLLYDNELWLVMELCDGGSLFDLKEAVPSFTEPELQAIIAFSVIGLAHLHAQRSIHRDVKTGNILLTKDGRAKLGDFGISAQLTDTIMKRRTVIGSPYWMAPEVIQETSYDGKADIWSLGITLMELCEGNPPHFNVHPMRAIFIISSRAAPTLKEPDNWSPELVDFLACCLVKNCEQRSTANDLLKHPWLRKTVKEIGSQGKGLPVLQNLIMTHWDEIERIRSVRFNLNPPDESPEHEDHSQNTSHNNSHNNSISHISPDNDPRDGRDQRAGGAGMGMNAAAAALSLAAPNAHHEDAYSIASSEKSSIYDDSTMRAISRQNSFSGIPATRQQMRNRSLSRSNSRSNSRSSTPIGTPSNPNRAAARLNNVGGSNIGMHFAYESDDGNHDHASPAMGVAVSKGSVHSTSNENIMSDFKSLDAKSENDFKRRKNPPREDKESKHAEPNPSGASRYDSPQSDYQLDDMVRTGANGSHHNGAAPQGSMVRAPIVRPVPPLDDVIITPVALTPGGTHVAPKAAAPKGGGFMNALKYFQDEPLPSDVIAKPIARKADADHKASSSNHNLGSSMVRVPTPTTTTTASADEMEMLNDLADGEAHNLFIKKEIMKHLSALKKQYRDDLESLTTAYESRRRVLKDALLLYSGSGPAGGGGGQGQGGHNRSHSASNMHMASENGDRAHKSRHAHEAEAPPKHSRLRGEDKN